MGNLPMDIKSYSRWDDYTKPRDEMIVAPDTPWSPWYVVPSGDKRRAQLNPITLLLGRVPYEEAPRKKGKLPRRQKLGKYKSPGYPFKSIPNAF